MIPSKSEAGSIPAPARAVVYPLPLSTASTPPLHHALRSMVDQRLLPHNPADRIEPPKVAHKSMTILNEEQLDTFLSAVEQAPTWKDFFYTELITSLRLGEIYALTKAECEAKLTELIRGMKQEIAAKNAAANAG